MWNASSAMVFGTSLSVMCLGGQVATGEVGNPVVLDSLILASAVLTVGTSGLWGGLLDGVIPGRLRKPLTVAARSLIITAIVHITGLYDLGSYGANLALHAGIAGLVSGVASGNATWIGFALSEQDRRLLTCILSAITLSAVVALSLAGLEMWLVSGGATWLRNTTGGSWWFWFGAFFLPLVFLVETGARLAIYRCPAVYWVFPGINLILIARTLASKMALDANGLVTPESHSGVVVYMALFLTLLPPTIDTVQHGKLRTSV